MNAVSKRDGNVDGEGGCPERSLYLCVVCVCVCVSREPRANRKDRNKNKESSVGLPNRESER